MNADCVLVDTSAWIAGFKKDVPPGLKEFLQSSIDAGTASTTSIIILELIQGCRTERERTALRSRLESLEVLPITEAVWERCYNLGFYLRRKGLTLPTVDIVIAGVALENNCLLLHHDKHFDLIAENFPSLRVKSFG